MWGCESDCIDSGHVLSLLEDIDSFVSAHKDPVFLDGHLSEGLIGGHPSLVEEGFVLVVVEVYFIVCAFADDVNLQAILTKLAVQETIATAWCYGAFYSIGLLIPQRS